MRRSFEGPDRGRLATQDVGDVAGQLLHRHRAGLQARSPLGKPDPDDEALADVRERQRGPAGRQLLAGGLRRLERVLIDRRERDPNTFRRLRLLERREARQLLDAGQQADLRIVGDRLERLRSALEPAQRTQRGAEGSASVGGSGRSSRSRATATPRRIESAPNDATRPPSVA